MKNKHENDIKFNMREIFFLPFFSFSIKNCHKLSEFITSLLVFSI